MADNGVIGIQISGDSTGLQRALNDAGRQVDGFGSKVREHSDTLGQFAHDLKSAFIGSSVAVGLIMLKNTLGEVTSAMVQAQVQADKLRNGLSFAVGKENATAEMGFIRDAARQLGLEYVTAAQQYTKFAAAAHGTSLEGQKARDVFLSIAQASTVMGLSAEETQGALLAVTQMVSKGKVAAEELRGQLGERLPGAFQVAARAMGVTTGELDKMLETGKVLSADFLPKFAAQLSQEVAPQVDQASKSMQASINRLSSAWTDFKQALAATGVSELIAGQAQGAARELELLRDTMDNTRKAGGNWLSQMLGATGVAALKLPIDMVSASSNALNFSLNALSGGWLKLNTNLDLSARLFRTNSESAGELDGKLKAAEAALADYQKRGADKSDNIYLKSEAYQAYLLVEQLRAAKAARDALQQGNATKEGIRAGGQAREEWMRADAERRKAQKEAYEKAMTTYATPDEKLAVELNKQREALGDLFTPDMEQRIRKHFTKPIHEGADVFGTLRAEIDKADQSAQQYLDTGEKLEASDKFRIEMLEKISEALRKKKITLAQAVDAESAMYDVQQKMLQVERLRREEKANSEAAAARVRELDDLQKSANAVAKQVEAERIHVEQIGLTKEAIADLEAARLEEQATILDGVAIKLLDRNLDQHEYELIKARADGLRALAKLKKEGVAKEVAADEAKRAAEEWRRAADKIQDTITDALMRGFESGKGFAENLRDAVVNIFKTMVLRPVVEWVVRGGMGVLGIGGAGAAAAGQGGGSGMGLGDAYSAYSTMDMLSGMKGWLTDFGGGVASQVSKLGNYLTTFSNETMQDWGTSLASNATEIGQYTEMVGNTMNYIDAAIAASEGKWGRAIGEAVGTYFFGPVGGKIGAAVGGWVDDAFGGGHEYTVGTGMSGHFSGKNFNGRYYQDWRNDGSSGFFGIGASGSSSGTNYSAMDAKAQGALGAAYGKLLDETAAFTVALGANADRVLNYQKDIRLALGNDAEANKKAIADMFKGIANEVAATVVDAKYIREGEGAADTLARLATSLAVVNGALDTLGDNLLAIGQYGGDIASSLVDAFGGLEKYQSAIGSYYARFYSEDERMNKAREQLQKQFAGLGLSMPDTLQAYRDMVNAQDLTTEAGRKTYAALIGLSGAFADVADYAGKAAGKVGIETKYFSTYADYAAAVAKANARAWGTSVQAALDPATTGAGTGPGLVVPGQGVVTETGVTVSAQPPVQQSPFVGGGDIGQSLNALREEAQAQARAMAAMYSRMVKTLEQWDAQGMPAVRT